MKTKRIFVIGQQVKLKNLESLSQKTLSECDANKSMWEYGNIVTVAGYFRLDNSRFAYRIKEDNGSCYYCSELFEVDEETEKQFDMEVKEEYGKLVGF